MTQSPDTPLTRALRLLTCLIDPDPCWFDHHGGCAAHLYVDLEPDELCPVREAKNLLDEQGIAWRNST